MSMKTADPARGKFSDAEACPIRNVLDRFGDKWSILVLLALDDYGTLRFNELHRAIGEVSQKMLTVTVRTLEADDLVKRTFYPEIPPRVEYQLTARGKSLMPHIYGLVNWALGNLQAIRRSRRKHEREETRTSAAKN
jgi:DNA-binding HxlR family transcriptional regulator